MCGGTEKTPITISYSLQWHIQAQIAWSDWATLSNPNILHLQWHKVEKIVNPDILKTETG